MNRQTALMLLLSVLVAISAVQTAKATSITAASLDKAAYLAGQTGYISATSGKNTANVEINNPTPRENANSSSIDNGSKTSVMRN